MIIPTLFALSLHSRSKTPTQMNPDSLLTLSLHVGSSTLLEKNAFLSDFIPHSWTKCPEFCLTTLSCFPTSHSPVTVSPFSPPQSCSTSSPLSWWLYLLCPPPHLPTWAPVPMYTPASLLWLQLHCPFSHSHQIPKDISLQFFLVSSSHQFPPICSIIYLCIKQTVISLTFRKALSWPHGSV